VLSGGCALLSIVKRLQKCLVEFVLKINREKFLMKVTNKLEFGNDVMMNG